MMTGTQRLTDAHKPLGIYNIRRGGNIYNELCVYGEELDRLQAELDKALRECFVSGAQDYGLDAAERVWGAVRDDLPLEKRREMILSRYALGCKDFTVSSVQKMLCALGVEGNIREFPAEFCVTIAISGQHTRAQMQWIRAQLRSLFGAHLEVTPVFEGFDWSDAEALGLTFADMENTGMCWDDVDIYCTP